MPWKERSVVDERLRFVARVLEGESMTEICREFGISRKTGYKLVNRYREEGPVAPCDRWRRPVRYANQLPEPVERAIVEAKKDKPRWGARKIRELLVRRLAGDVRIPAVSTVHAVLDRHGLVTRARKRRRNRATGTALSAGTQPGDLWCADFKGEFKTGDGRYCYPLTVTDHASRRIMAVEALETTREVPVIAAFERLFKGHGLPGAMRTDNGLPFASPNRLYNLSKLSGLVAAARHRHRTHQARTPAAERPPRAHAPDAEAGDRAAAGAQHPRPEGALRRLQSRVQQRTAPRGARHGDTGRRAAPRTPALRRPARAGIPVP